MIDLMVKIAGWGALALYGLWQVIKAERKGYRRGLLQGYAQGYSTAMDKWKVTIERANELARMDQDMSGEDMTAQDYTKLLEQSFIVASGIHDAERKGLL